MQSQITSASNEFMSLRSLPVPQVQKLSKNYLTKLKGYIKNLFLYIK